MTRRLSGDREVIGCKTWLYGSATTGPGQDFPTAVGPSLLQLFGKHFLSLQTESLLPHSQTIVFPGLELLKDEVGKEMVEDPSHRKGDCRKALPMDKDPHFSSPIACF